MKKIVNRNQLLEMINESLGFNLSTPSVDIVSKELEESIQENPTGVIRTLLELYGDDFFAMLKEEEKKWLRANSPIDENKKINEESEDADQRATMRNYIKTLMPVVRGEEEFDRMHEIELDYMTPKWNSPKKRFLGIDVILEKSIPDTGYEEFDKKVAEAYIKYLLSSLSLDDVIIQDIKFY